MAKQTKVSETGPTTLRSAAPAKSPIKEPNGADKFIRVLGPDGKGTPAQELNGKGTMKKMAPQAVIIANVLEAAGPDGMTRAALVAALPAAGLVTRQPVGRILSYYQKPLIDAGVVVLDRATVAATAA